MLRYLSFLAFLSNLPLYQSDHYKGGTLVWRPVIPTSLSNPVQLIITVRQSWTLSRYQCNETNINVFGAYNDTNNVTAPSITCISSSASCTAAGFQDITLPLRCTDFSSSMEVSTGVFTTRQNYSHNSVIDLAWRGASWSTDTFTNAWSMISRINLTPIFGRINSPPVTISLPVVQVFVNQTTAIQILAADWDPDQIVRCRWSYQLPEDECGSVCYNLPNASLSAQDCAITWRAVLRPEDVAAGRNYSTYVIAITAEDFVNASSTTPLSATPHQMIVRAYILPSDRCSSRPDLIWAPRRHQACFAIGVGSTWTFSVTGRVFCWNDSIVEFITLRPAGMNVSNIIQRSNFTWEIQFRWIPTSDQLGIQPFCATAMDNNGVTTNIICYSIAVGGINVGISLPAFVQSSASPLGTVMATHTRFSIQATQPLRRTTKNNTLITIRRVDTNALVRSIDCKYSPDVFYINQTIIFYVRNPPWVLGVSYYVSFSEGVATANLTCGAESGGFGAYYWVFTIWNPAMSSTTTPPTTTTTATLGTVTTRSMATTTPNTAFTTTGISAITTRTTTSTSSTSSVTTTTTTSATTTTTTTTSTTESIPNAKVMYPKDMERECVQAATIATMIVTVVMIPVHLYGMINLFVKMNAQFQQEMVKKRMARHQRALRWAKDAPEIETLVLT